MGALVASASARIALGLTTHLAPFALKHGARAYWEWGGNNWRANLLLLAVDPAVAVLWCLDGLGEFGAIELWQQEVLQPNNSNTGWELMQFCYNPAWKPRTTWWHGDTPVPNPLPEAVCG